MLDLFPDNLATLLWIGFAFGAPGILYTKFVVEPFANSLDKDRYYPKLFGKIIKYVFKLPKGDTTRRKAIQHLLISFFFLGGWICMAIITIVKLG
jgi:hypothetical protein